MTGNDRKTMTEQCIYCGAESEIGQAVAFVAQTIGNNQLENDRAALIASAPDLLRERDELRAALLEAVRVEEVWNETTGAELPPWIGQARKALGK